MKAQSLSEEYLDKVVSGDVTASEHLADCFKVMDRTEPDVKAWCLRDNEAAKVQAEHLDKEMTMGKGPRGALHGLNVGVKDIIDTADMLTELGSRSCIGRQPKSDAHLVSQLRAAGAILPGKTATTEFAYMDRTDTRNPRNLAHSPGGSSSGSAAAIAAGQISLAIGTQTGGSVIRPASYCGIYGMKPSFGTISRNGVLQTAQTLDQVGLFANSLKGIGRLCDVIVSGTEQMMDAACNAADSVRLLRFEGLYGDIVDDGVNAALDIFVMELGDAVKTRPAPVSIAPYLAAHKTVYEVELAQNLGPVCEEKSALIGPAVNASVATGMTHHQDAYDAALGMRVRAIAELSSYFRAYDILITPAATSEAPLFEDGTGNPTCNALWSFLGFPCLTLPLLTGPKGLPIGVQLIGAMGTDIKVLQSARWLLETYPINGVT